MKTLRILLGGLLVIAPAAAQTKVDSERVYVENEVTLEPLVLRQPALAYPDSLRRAGVGGTVHISLVLDRRGRPDSGSVRIVASPESALNAPARAVVLGARYAPAWVEGQAVRARIEVSVPFDPSDSSAPPLPIYDENDSLTQKPAILSVSGSKLEYPAASAQRRVQGRVLTQAIVDTLGRVEQGSIQFITTPDPAFLMTVGQYLLHAQFRPAVRNGHPVRCLVHIPVDFRIRPGGPPFRCSPRADRPNQCSAPP